MGKGTIQNLVKTPKVSLESVAKVMMACKRAGYYWDAQKHQPFCTWSSFSVHLSSKVHSDQSSDFDAYFLYSGL